MARTKTKSKNKDFTELSDAELFAPLSETKADLFHLRPPLATAGPAPVPAGPADLAAGLARGNVAPIRPTSARRSPESGNSCQTPRKRCS